MEIAQQQEDRNNVEQFMARVRKYTRLTELTTLVMNELVERIVIYAPDKSSGKRVQKIEVIFNYVGKIELSHEPLPKSPSYLLVAPFTQEIQSKTAKNG